MRSWNHEIFSWNVGRCFDNSSNSETLNINSFIWSSGIYNSQENICARVSFLIKFFIIKESLAQVSSYKFCEFFNNTFEAIHLRCFREPWIRLWLLLCGSWPVLYEQWNTRTTSVKVGQVYWLFLWTGFFALGIFVSVWLTLNRICLQRNVAIYPLRGRLQVLILNEFKWI